jgi:Skp family chaperone for outer membrane proteins
MNQWNVRRVRGAVLVLGIAVWLSLLGVAQAQKGLKVGVVDLQAVLDSSVRGKAAKDRLQQLGLKLQEEIKDKRQTKEEREKELQKLRTELRSQGLVLSKKAQEEKAEVFRNQVRELKRFIDDTNRFIEDATQEFREREVRETQRLLQEIRDVVQEVGKQQKYSLILEGNEGAALVLYFSSAVSLTSEIVQRYDQASASKR